MAEFRVCSVDEKLQVRDQWFEWLGPARASRYGAEDAELTHCGRSLVRDVEAPLHSDLV